MNEMSADMFLGVPFNIASYSLLTMMIAQQCGLDVGEFIWTGGDVHLYENHIEQAKLQLSRKPLGFPNMRINKADDIFSYKYEDFVLTDYNSHEIIRADVAV